MVWLILGSFVGLGVFDRVQPSNTAKLIGVAAGGLGRRRGTIDEFAGCWPLDRANGDPVQLIRG